jgi:TonB family protein
MNRLNIVLAGAAICLLSSTVAAQQVDRDDPASPIRVKAIEIVALDDIDEQRLRKLLPIREGNFVRDSDFARTAKIIRAHDRGLTFSVKLDKVEGAVDGARDATIRISGAGFGPAVYRQPARLKFRVEPDYPPEVRQAHVQGRVEINILIGADGLVRNPQPINGPAPLIEPALTAVKQWKYDPELVNGDPVEAKLTVDFEYYPDGPPAPPQATQRPVPKKSQPPE